MAGSKVSAVLLATTTVLSLSLAAYMSVRAQQPARTESAAGSLSALDHVEIRNLVAKYARTIDTCSNNGYDYADLYTVDGSFNSSRDGKLGTVFEGRERLAEAAGGGVRGCKKLQRAGGLWIHAIVNLVIEASSDGAVGTSDLVYPSLREVDFDADHSGHVGNGRCRPRQVLRAWRSRRPRYHHYAFELCALSGMLNLPADATRAQLLDAMKDIIVGKAAYVGRFRQ